VILVASTFSGRTTSSCRAARDRNPAWREATRARSTAFMRAASYPTLAPPSASRWRYLTLRETPVMAVTSVFSGRTSAYGAPNPGHPIRGLLYAPPRVTMSLVRARVALTCSGRALRGARRARDRIR
jgi:hypothetical protein